MPSLFRTLGLAAIIASVSSAASAAPVFFTDRATFQANTGALTTESLDSITEGGNVTVQPTGVTVTAGGGAGSFAQDNGVGFFSEGAASLQVFGWDAGATLTFVFDSPIIAFGVDFLDDTSPFDMDLTVNGAAGSFISNLDHRVGVDGPLFLGVIDAATPFTQLVISSNADNGLVNFDFVQFETAETADVPAPATLALLGFGLAGLGAIARRRKKAA